MQYTIKATVCSQSVGAAGQIGKIIYNQHEATVVEVDYVNSFGRAKSDA